MHVRAAESRTPHYPTLRPGTNTSGARVSLCGHLLRRPQTCAARGRFGRHTHKSHQEPCELSRLLQGRRRAGHQQQAALRRATRVTQSRRSGQPMAWTNRSSKSPYAPPQAPHASCAGPRGSVGRATWKPPRPLCEHVVESTSPPPPGDGLARGPIDGPFRSPPSHLDFFISSRK